MSRRPECPVCRKTVEEGALQRTVGTRVVHDTCIGKVKTVKGDPNKLMAVLKDIEKQRLSNPEKNKKKSKKKKS